MLSTECLGMVEEVYGTNASVVLFRHLLETTLGDHDTDGIHVLEQYAFAHHILLVGMSNYRGAWSENVIALQGKIGPLTITPIKTLDDVTKKLAFSAYLSPGAADSFPKDGSIFNIAYMENNENLRLNERIYQKVLKTSTEQEKGYYGVCNGAQHLTLHYGGYLQEVPNHTKGNPHTVTMIPGTIGYFYTLGPEEQSLALNHGFYPDVTFTIDTRHHFAAVPGQLGTVELAGLSDAGVVEFVSKGFFKIGTQFHPENLIYQADDVLFLRNQYILENVFKMFATAVAKGDLSLEEMDRYMQKRLDDSFAKAQCFYDQDSCPAPAFTSDLFAEVLHTPTTPTP